MRPVALAMLALAASALNAAADDEVHPHVTMPASSFLDPSGYLNLPAHFQGSLDPEGLQLVSNPGEPPRFVPAAKSSDPADARWSSAFGLLDACNGIVTTIVEDEGGALYLGGTFTACSGVSANRIVRHEPATGTWTALGQDGGNGFSGTVNALHIVGGQLYAGGSFTQANVGADIPANRIARWDGDAWHAIGRTGGNGLDGAVLALAEYGEGLAIAGSFTLANVGGAEIAANNVVVLDPANDTWTALGSNGGNGLGGQANALEVVGNDLFVGGFFTSANVDNPTTTSRVARWDGRRWSALAGDGGQGVSNTVWALRHFDGALYVGGFFTAANMGNDVAANRIARYDLGAGEWSPVGSGGGNGVASGSVRTLTLRGQELLIGGAFGEANVGAGFGAAGVVRWSGSSFLPMEGELAAGLPGEVRTIHVGADAVHFGGNFHQILPAPERRIHNFARLHNGVLSSPGLRAEAANGSILALASLDGDLYVGGTFTAIGGIAANRIARWDGHQWSAVRSGGGNGVSSSVFALAVHRGALYVGGAFTVANLGADVIVNRVARWDGQAWSALGDGGVGVSGSVLAFATDGSDLYVGGAFTEANVGSPVVVNRIARWNGAQWSALGNGGIGVSATVRALSLFRNDLYLGGDFQQANVGAAIAANRIARWNGTAFSAVGSGGGNGVNDSVFALAVYQDALYAGGGFTSANFGAAIAANRIARFDGNAWSTVGSLGGQGTSGPVRSLIVHDNELVAGGGFVEANVGAALPVNHVATWDGARWRALTSGGGRGTNGDVRALASHAGALAVGGLFLQANAGNPVDAPRLAHWDGLRWQPFGGQGHGIGGSSVSAILRVGGDIYVGGNFRTAGGLRANSIARWNGQSWTALGSGGGNGIEGSVSALAELDGLIYVGGAFSEVNAGAAVPALNVASYDPSSGQWAALGSSGGNGVDNQVYALAAYQDRIYAGGLFDVVNVGASLSSPKIARFDPVAGTWSRPGNLDVASFILAFAVAGDVLYAGGGSMFSNGQLINGVARWNGTTWSPLGSGIGTLPVWSLLATADGRIVAGGAFLSANLGPSAIPVNRLAVFEPTSGTWSALGSGGADGVDGTVFALSEIDGDIYAGGNFTHANIGNAVPAAHIARFDAASGAWHALGQGASAQVSSLAEVDAGALLVGGTFLTAGATDAMRIARYSGRGRVDAGLIGTGTGMVSGSGGISCPTACSGELAWGETVALAAQASAGATFSGWSGACSGSGACVIELERDVDITARFDIVHTVTATAGAGGRIEPAGEVIVLTGNSESFALLPDKGFGLDRVENDCGGTLDGLVFTTNPVAANCSVNASFRLNTYTVTPSATQGGSIKPSTPQAVEHGQTLAFAVAAEASHYLANVAGSCGGSLVGNAFITAPVTASCEIEAQYLPRVATSSLLSITPNPPRLNQVVAFTLLVSGDGQPPTDGTVTVSASTGETCADDGAPAVTGNTASFVCPIAFTSYGPRSMSAQFSDSRTHLDSGATPVPLQVVRLADLSISIDDGLDRVRPGDDHAYLIEVRNSGPDAAPASQVAVTVTPALSDPQWSCRALGDATCPELTGDGILESVDLAVDAGLDLVLSGRVPEAAEDVIVARADVLPRNDAPDFVFDPAPASNTATDINLISTIFSDSFEPD